MTRFFKSAFGGGNALSGSSKQLSSNSKVSLVSSFSNTSLSSEAKSEAFAKVVPTNLAPKSKSSLQRSEALVDTQPQSAR
jgi:hypothetical protein